MSHFSMRVAVESSDLKSNFESTTELNSIELKRIGTIQFLNAGNRGLEFEAIFGSFVNSTSR